MAFDASWLDSDSDDVEATSGPRSFGDYELLEEIARGGMGVVYRARQKSLNRTVAIKMILSGQFASRHDIQRFRAEAEAAAHLQHPNIVAIHEIGEHDGRPFFSMEFVNGKNLGESIQGNPLPPRQAAGYVRIIAEAIHYAHEHGVVHRDLKPSNVLINVHGEPKVTDFGLAKRLTADSSLTRTGQVLGSPNFSPPEQAGGQAKTIGPAADIYSLGSILYYLLTGRPPFLADSVEQTLVQVLRQEPASPRLVNASVPPDLETICLKCLEKEPARRYGSAQEVAEELRRFAKGLPIRARPLSPAQHVWRWCRRNPALASTTAAAALALGVGFISVSWQWRRAERHAQSESIERARAERNLTSLQVQRAEDLLEDDKVSEGLAYLAHTLRRDPRNQAVAERIISVLSHRSLALPLGPSMRHEAPLNFAEMSPDGLHILTASEDGSAHVWNVATGQREAILEHDGEVRIARFSPNGRFIVTASADHSARVWSAETRELVFALRHDGPVNDAKFSPDNRLIVTASEDRRVRIFDAQTGELIGGPLEREASVIAAHFDDSSDRVVAVARVRPSAIIWDITSGKVLQTLSHPQSWILSANFSPDGKYVVTAGYDRHAAVWDSETGRRVHFLEHGNVVTDARFSPDGDLIVTVSRDTAARVWDARTGEPYLDPLPHGMWVHSAKFTPDSHGLATVAGDSTVSVWDLSTGHRLVEPIVHNGPVVSVAFDAGGDKLVSASDQSAQVWSIVPGIAPELVMPNGSRKIHEIKFSPDGNRLLALSQDGNLRLWDVRTGEALGPPMRHGAWILCADFDAGGKRIACGGMQGIVSVWDSRTFQELYRFQAHPLRVHAVEFSPNARRLFTASFDGTARLWDAATREPVPSQLMRHNTRIWHATYSKDARWIATASDDPGARVWDAATGEAVTPLLEHRGPLKCVAFSPDHSILATASEDHTARLWSLPDGRLIRTLDHAATVVYVRFSPDGNHVVTASLDHTARIWKVSDAESPAIILRHKGGVLRADFSPDSQRVATASVEARIWDVSTGMPASEPLPHDGSVTTLAFSPDGHWLATASANQARMWDVIRGTEVNVQALASLGEAVGGLKLTGNHDLQGVRGASGQLRWTFLQADRVSGVSRWLDWFWEDRRERNISAHSSVSVPEWIDRATEEGSTAGLERSLALAPTNALTLGRYSLGILGENSAGESKAIHRADRLTRKALANSENISEVWRARALVLEAKERFEEALEAWSRVVQLRSTNQGEAYESALMSRRAALLRLDQPREAQADWLRAKKIPERDPLTPEACLDLAPHFNAAVWEDWHGRMWIGNNLAMLPTGLRRLNGIDFDIRGIIQLGSPEIDQSAPGYPRRVEGIKVGRPCATIHFLHAAAWGNYVPRGAQIGSYVIWYADGERREIPIKAREDLGEWQIDANSPRRLKRTEMIWEGVGEYGRQRGLFLRTWQNPRPNIEVSHIDFISSGAAAAPFLVAITAE